MGFEGNPIPMVALAEMVGVATELRLFVGNISTTQP